MSQVRIPPVLRPSAGGQKLLDDAGEINRFVNVFVNETDVRHLQVRETPVGERDTLLLLPAMAGG